MPVTPTIDSVDEVVGDFLHASLESLREHGGWLHPAARIIEREGHLTIECDANEGEILLSVPRSALLPVTRIAWSFDDAALSIDSMDQWPDEADLGLLLTQIGLHNACAKIPYVASTHPSVATTLNTSVISAVQALEPSFRQRSMSAAEVFWATRALSATAFSGTPEPIAVPILDLLNHYCGGATPAFDGGFTVSVAHPTGTSECFLDYGLSRDAIEMAVVYGFADESTQHAHSAPVRFSHPEAGEVIITDLGRSSTGELLPITVSQESEAWILNRLPLAEEDVVDQLMNSGGPSKEWSQVVVECARALNLELLDDLDAALSMEAVSPAADVLSAAVGHQHGLLSWDA